MEKRDKAWAIFVVMDYALQTNFDMKMIFVKIAQIEATEGISFSEDEINTLIDIIGRMSALAKKE